MDLWSWHAERWTREPWTLWTAALGHLSAGHALANALALAALLALALAWGLDRRALWASLAAWPLSIAALALWPQVRAYSGLSGPLHAVAAVLLVQSLARDARAGQRPDATVLVLGAGLLAKLGLEQAWAVPIAFDANWGFNVVYAAHLAGALAGALCGAAFEFSRRPAPTPARR